MYENGIMMFLETLNFKNLPPMHYFIVQWLLADVLHQNEK